VPFHQPLQWSAYQSKLFSSEEIDSVLQEMDPWITFQRFDSEQELLEDAAEALDSGKVSS